MGVGKVAASGSSRGEERVVEGVVEGGERHDAGRAVQESGVKEVAEVVPRTRRRAAAAKAAVAGDSEERVMLDKGVLKEGTSVAVVDASSSEKLPAPAASKTKKTVKKSTKKNDGAVQYEDGLGALHEAMRLSGGIHFDDDPTAVIKAEALEDRKVRMMAQSQTKRKRGRPRKTDTVSAAGRKRVTRAHVCDTQDDEGDTQEASASMGETDGGKRKSSRKSVLSKALVKLEDAPAAGGENSNGEEDGKAVPKKPVINNLADKTLDAENWTLKDIVKWGNARERKLAKEQAKTQQKTYVRPLVQPVQETEPPLLHPKVHVKDGKIVVDQTSLTVAAQQKEEYTKIVTEDSHSINSMSYVNRLSNDRWSIEDTELFFRVCVSFHVITFADNYMCSC